MTVQLRGGYAAEDPRLGRIPQFDEASKNFRAAALFATTEIPLPRSYSWRCNTWIDQGQEGSCVGHGWAHEIAARPVEVPADHTLALRIYNQAKVLDEFPGEDYDGTSVLAGAKAATAFGYYGEYRWAFSLVEALSALTRKGPVVIGVNWYDGMFDTDKSGYIHVSGDVAGGHCILVRGAKCVWKVPTPASISDLDLDKSYVTLHNSWGQSWGVNGEARLTVRDFDRLRTEDGDVCVPVKRLTPKV